MRTSGKRNHPKEARVQDGSSPRLPNYHAIFIPISGRGLRSSQIRARSSFPTIRSRDMRKPLIDREHTDTRECGLCSILGVQGPIIPVLYGAQGLDVPPHHAISFKPSIPLGLRS